MDTQIVPYPPGMLLRGGQLSGGDSKLIFFFYPFHVYPVLSFSVFLYFSFNLTCLTWILKSGSVRKVCLAATKLNASIMR